MSTVISTALRNFKEPTKEQLTQIFFSLPPDQYLYSYDQSEKEKEKGKMLGGGGFGGDEKIEKMDINAVLSLGVQGEEESYVGGYLLFIYYYYCFCHYVDRMC